MNPSLHGGYLIAVEGIDGAGKTTLTRLLHAELTRRRMSAIVSREPTDGPWGKLIREHSRTCRLGVEEEVELLVKDRRQHVTEVISPAHARGEIVILDRYFFSMAAYQGITPESIDELLNICRAFAPEPDLLLVLDLEPDVSLERITSRGGTASAYETRETLRRTRETYRALPNAVLVDASLPEEEVFRCALQYVVTSFPALQSEEG